MPASDSVSAIGSRVASAIFTDEPRAELPDDPLVCWPMKKTEKLELETILRTYIADKHGRGRRVDWERPVQTLGDMRVVVEGGWTRTRPLEQLLKGHYLYAALLTHASQHFPLTDGRLATFRWTDIDCATVCSSPSVNVEIACVLFNTAVLHCHLALTLKHTVENLTKAAHQYLLAAGLWEAVRERLTGEKPLSRDTSSPMLDAMAKGALCHAAHMQYLAHTLELPEGHRTAGDWEAMASEAYDVSRAYQEVHPLLASDALRASVPAALVYQAEVYWWVFELRAYLNRAAALELMNNYGGAVAAVNQARRALRHAEIAAAKVAKLAAAVRDLKPLIERAQKHTGDANVGAQQLVPALGDSQPLVASNRPRLQPMKCNKRHLAACPEDPFKDIPVLGYIKPRPLIDPEWVAAQQPHGRQSPTLPRSLSTLSGEGGPTAQPHGRQSPALPRSLSTLSGEGGLSGSPSRSASFTGPSMSPTRRPSDLGGPLAWSVPDGAAAAPLPPGPLRRVSTTASSAGASSTVVSQTSLSTLTALPRQTSVQYSDAGSVAHSSPTQPAELGHRHSWRKAFSPSRRSPSPRGRSPQSPVRGPTSGSSSGSTRPSPPESRPTSGTLAHSLGSRVRQIFHSKDLTK